ncbi:MAG: DNA repair protein RadA [Propionibacteriaceae bacterium]|jgi:DNA repair protein RadA/Sms|nr:DNA repair protein RadA [Propionibacteriaceae bacterium]
MSKLAKVTYRCSACGWETPKWAGRCGGCAEWNTLAEAAAPARAGLHVVAPLQPARPITEVDPAVVRRASTGVGELDRVLGGGLVPGSVVLLAGEPGVGKSTLLLEAAARWAKDHGPTLYVSGEESTGQVRLRALRTGANHRDLYLAAETDLAAVVGQIEAVGPSLVVVDSVQTVSSDAVEGAPGGVAQVKAVAVGLTQVAKGRGVPVILIGHVTKDGSVAGPRTLEHLVDVVVSFEGDPHSGFRLIRATKNRFGPADEVGCFELTDAGIREVRDPSGQFTSRHGEPVPGTALTVTLEGRRPLVAELQALVAGSNAPRRVAQGLDAGRLAMVLAVLERRARVRLADKDVYVSTVGGARVTDPAADLPLALAIASAARDEPVPGDCVAVGEVGLAGELRRVPDVAKRLAEAARLGVTQAIVPLGSLPQKGRRDRRLASVTPVTVKEGLPEMEVVEAATLADALTVLGLRRAKAEGQEVGFGPVLKWGS